MLLVWRGQSELVCPYCNEGRDIRLSFYQRKGKNNFSICRLDNLSISPSMLNFAVDSDEALFTLSRKNIWELSLHSSIRNELRPDNERRFIITAREELMFQEHKIYCHVFQ